MSGDASPLAIEDLLAHDAWVRRLAERLARDPSDADELVQRTWLAAMRRPPRDARAPRAWLGQVLRNVARQLRRESAARVHHEQALDRSHSAASADELVERMEFQRRLADRVLALDEPYRSTLLLRYYGEVPAAEIARRLDVPEGTVRWRAMRGLELLRAELDREHGGDRPAWVKSLLACAGLPAPEAALGTGAAGGLAPAGALKLLPLVALLALSTISIWRIFGPDVGDSGRALERALAAERAQAPAESALAPSTGARVAHEAIQPVAASGARAAPPPAARQLLVAVVGPDGARVGGATVSVLGADGTLEPRGQTDPGGELALTVIARDFGHSPYWGAEGRVTLRAHAAGRSASQQHHLAWPADERSRVTLELGGEALTVRGQVRDSEGRAVAGALVSIGPIGVPRQERATPGHLVSWAAHRARTDAAGRFALAHLPRELSVVEVAARGFLKGHNTLTPGAEPEVELDLRLVRAAVVEGVVRGRDGRPRAGVRVFYDPRVSAGERERFRAGYVSRLLGYSEVATSDAQGAFRLDSVAPGPARFWAVGPYGSGEVASEVLSVEADRRWEPRLAERHGLRLLAVDPEGAALAGWVLHLTSERALEPRWQRRLEVPESGLVELIDVPEGPLVARLFDPLFDAQPRETRRGLAPSASVVEFVHDPHALRDGMLRVAFDSAESPLPGGTVRLFDAANRSAAAVLVDPRTSAVEQALRAGRYRVDARFPSLGVIPLGEHEIAPGTTLDLGVVRVPQRGTVRFVGDWAQLDPRGAWTWSLSAVSPSDGEFPALAAIASGPLGPRDAYRVLPGVYRYTLARDGSAVGVRRVAVAAGDEARLDVLPDGPLHLPLVFDPAVSGSEPGTELALRVTRLDGDGAGEVLLEARWPRTAGAFTGFVALAPGAYGLEAETDAGLFASAELELTPLQVIHSLRFPLE